MQEIRILTQVINDRNKPDKASVLVEHLVERALARMPRLRHVDLNNWFLMRQKPKVVAQMMKQKDLMGRLGYSYKNSDMDKVLTKATEFFTLQKKIFQYFDDADEVYLLKMYIAAAKIFNGELNSEKFLEGLLIMNPKYEYTEGFSTPEINDAFIKAKKTIPVLMTGTMTITSEPVSAKIYLNGKFIGVTPYKTKKLTVGEHFLKVEATGFIPVGKVIDVFSDDPNKVHIPLTPYNQKRALKSLRTKLYKNITNIEPVTYPKDIEKYLELVKFDQILLMKTRQAPDKTIFVTLYVYDRPTKSRVKNAISFFFKENDPNRVNIVCDQIKRILDY